MSCTYIMPVSVSLLCEGYMSSRTVWRQRPSLSVKIHRHARWNVNTANSCIIIVTGYVPFGFDVPLNCNHSVYVVHVYLLLISIKFNSLDGVWRHFFEATKRRKVRKPILRKTWIGWHLKFPIAQVDSPSQLRCLEVPVYAYQPIFSQPLTHFEAVNRLGGFT